MSVFADMSMILQQTIFLLQVNILRQNGIFTTTRQKILAYLPLVINILIFFFLKSDIY